MISLPAMVPTTRFTLMIGKFGANFFAALDRRFADLEQLGHVQRLFEAMVLVLLAEAAHFRPGFG